MTGRTSTKVMDRAGTPGLGDRTCHDEGVAKRPEARVLQNEVSKAKGPIGLFDTEPKPQDRPRRATAPEEGKKTAIAQKARKGVSDALQGRRAAPGPKAERCRLPARELRERRELIVPPPRARAGDRRWLCDSWCDQDRATSSLRRQEVPKNHHQRHQEQRQPKICRRVRRPGIWWQSVWVVPTASRTNACG